MKTKRQTPMSCPPCRLHVGEAARGAVADTFAQYSAALKALADLAEREGIRSDAVRLQRRSHERIARATGVPAFGGHPRAAEMNALERLHRDKTVEERLAGFRFEIAD